MRSLTKIARNIIVLCALISCAHGFAFAQLWNGILTPPRAVDWRNSGPQTLPTGYTICQTIAPYTGTAATINTALSTCGAHTIVQLGTGTFTLSTGILLNQNNVLLNGNGANQTIISFTSAAASSCNGFSATICIFGGDSTFWIPGTGITVTGGLTQGSTSITVDNASTIQVGKAIVINSCDTGKSGTNCAGTSTDNGNVYNTGDIYSTSGPTGASLSGADSGNGTPSRFSSEVHTVTNVVGTTITLGEPIEHTTWISPQAWTFNPITGSGVTNIGVNIANNTSAIYGIGLFNGCNDVITGNAVINPQVSSYALTDACHILIESFYADSAQSSDNFGVHLTQVSDSVIDNFDVQQNTVGLMCEGPCNGNVIAYGYFTAMCNYLGLSQDCASDDVSQAIRFHSNGDDYNLIEGICGTAIDADGTHGTHLFNTYYRNCLPAWESCATSPYCGANNAKDFLTNSILLYALQGRYANVLLNLMGTSGYHTSYNFTSGQVNTALILLGAQVSGNTPPPDSIVGSSTMFWGNWDVVHGATQWNASEVPTNIAVDPNALPSATCSQTNPNNCPASFYLSTKPSWWAATKPFPAMGQDVSSGNIGQCSGTLNVAGQFNGLLSLSNVQCGNHGFTPNALGGHANSIPAMDCALNIMGIPLDGTGPAATFNAATCFTSSSTAPIFSLSPTSLAFSSQNLNTTSPSQTFTLTNTGTAALTISSIVISGTNATSFFQSNNCQVGGSLGINSSCTITVSFTPLSIGSLTASVVFTDSASDSPQSAALSGTGVQAIFSSQSTARISGNAVLK